MQAVRFFLARLRNRLGLQKPPRLCQCRRSFERSRYIAMYGAIGDPRPRARVRNVTVQPRKDAA